MAIHQNPDRNVEYMKKTWGTNSLITDYWSNPKNKNQNPIDYKNFEFNTSQKPE